MQGIPTVTRVERSAATGDGDTISLDYDARLVRRKRLTSDAGVEFLLDLPETISLNEGDCFQIEDNRTVAVRAAPEPLLAVSGDLPRLAWHIGNRHTPCMIEANRLLIRQDHVLARMLETLGAELSEVTGPFTPEGGAYGHGRTFAHAHGHNHDHAHG